MWQTIVFLHVFDNQLEMWYLSYSGTMSIYLSSKSQQVNLARFFSLILPAQTTYDSNSR